MSKRVLFLALHRPDRSPSQRFRFEQYLSYLDKNGFTTRFVYLLNASDDKAFYGAGAYFGKLRILFSSVFKLTGCLFSKYDVVYVQRECFMLGTSFFERQFAKQSKLIFDFDDSIWVRQEVMSGNKSLSFLKKPEKTIDIIKAAHMVFAGNEYLANFAKTYNNTIRIVPTTIDTQEYQRVPQPARSYVCIGWSGSFTTIEHFKEALPALEIIKQKYGEAVKIKVIGDGTYRNPQLDIVGLPWIKADEINELSEIDIGIMPLPDDDWAKGKCGLKGLQYMALEITTIMSPVGVNTEIIQHGVNGYLASKVEEWVAVISMLIEDPELRVRVGKEGRNTVVNHYSVDSTKEKYVRYLNEVLN